MIALLLTAAPQKDTGQKKLRKELESAYKKWRDVDVAYIITDEERAAFDRLHNDEEREQFIEQFWQRRDPTPDTEENEFKEEHYRRFAYANEHLASGVPGWKTDRGRIYILHGPPDEIMSHPSGGTYQRTPSEGGGTSTAFPFEQWRYRYIEAAGTDITIEFVDPTMTGEYRMTIDPTEKDALLHVPGHAIDPATQSRTASNNEFDRLAQMVNVMRPPRAKFPDLAAFVTSNIQFNTLPMKVRVDFIPITEATVYTAVSVQFENRDLQFHLRDGMQKAAVELAGRVNTMTQRRVTSFEDTVEVQCLPEQLQEYVKRKSIYQKIVPLAPGAYRLNLVAKDTVGGNLITYPLAIIVPQLEPDRPSASSLILADLVERVANRNAGAGQFVIGAYKVRPRVDGVFRNDETLWIYFQGYNLRGGTGEVRYEITGGAGAVAVGMTKEVAAAGQITVVQPFPLKDFSSGQYKIRVKVNQHLEMTGQFAVTQ